MATGVVIAGALIALAFIVGAVLGVRWTSQVWFDFLDDYVGEEAADLMIDRFKEWQPFL